MTSDQLLIATRGALSFGDSNGALHRLQAPGTLFVPAGASLVLKGGTGPRAPLLVQIELSAPGQQARALVPPIAVGDKLAAAGPSPSGPAVVHLCAVAGGKASAASELEMLLRSVRATSALAPRPSTSYFGAGLRRFPWRFLALISRLIVCTGAREISVHVIVSPETEVLVRAMLNQTRWAWREAETALVTEKTIQWLVRSHLPGFNIREHHSGPWGSAKSFLHHLLPAVDRCIFMDTDMLVFGEIGAE